MFCVLVVLAKVLLLAKWLARKTPLRKPNRGEGIISIKHRPKNVHDFLGILYCFIVLLCICVVSCRYVIYYPTVIAWYSLFVLKVPLNPKQTKKQTNISWAPCWLPLNLLARCRIRRLNQALSDLSVSTGIMSALLLFITHWPFVIPSSNKIRMESFR